MPSGKVTFGIALGTLLIGLSLGQAAEGDDSTPPQPKPKIVEVPHTIIKYEDRPVPAALPESCKQAEETISQNVTNNDGLTKPAGQILLALQALGTGVAEPDIKAINQATEVIRAEKDKLDSAAISQAQNSVQLKTDIEACEEDSK